MSVLAVVSPLAASVLALSPLPPQITAIADVTVLTGKPGADARLEHQNVVLVGETIADLGPASGPNKLALPSGVVAVSGVGKVLTPGLFATESQLGLVEIGLENSSDDDHLDGSLTPGFRAADGYSPLSPRIAVDREEGITAALLTPPLWKLLAGSGHVVEFDSRLASVPANVPAVVVGAYGGDVANAHGGSRGGALLALREAFDDARFLQKNAAAFERGEARALSMSPTHLRALFPVLGGTTPLLVRVDRASDIRALLSFAAEQKVKLVIDSGIEAWLVADELARAGVPVIVHPSVCGEVTLDALHARDDLAALLARAGVPVIVSSWDSVNGTSRVRQEAALAVQNGLPYDEAIASITSRPTALFTTSTGSAPASFHGAPSGVIQKGAHASVVLWSGDPLEALSTAERIWVGGTAITTPSRQRQLADKYKRLTPALTPKR